MTNDSENGRGTVVRHTDRVRSFEPAFGDPDVIDAVSDHIEAHLGPVESVFHEIVSDLVHIDLHWVPPHATRGFHTLVTSGMSERPMNVPEGVSNLEYAELVLNLPAEWPMEHSSWNEESHYWPIRLLKTLARMPHEYNTWLSLDHTVGNGELEAYGPGTQQCAALIAPCISAPREFSRLMTGGRAVNFFSVLPLYREELEHKLGSGIDSLYAKLERAHVGDIVAPTRVNVCAPQTKRKGLLSWLRG